MDDAPCHNVMSIARVAVMQSYTMTVIIYSTITIFAVSLIHDDLSTIVPLSLGRVVYSML